MPSLEALPEARQWNSQPVLMHPDFVRSAVTNIRDDRAGLMPHEVSLAALSATYGREFVAEKPFAFVDGVAVIPITGSLHHRFAGSWGWATGYVAIRMQLSAALADPDVERILFDVNSGGGDAAGCFELSEEIFKARGIKPMYAAIDSACYSAAYALASAVDKIFITRSGGAGSIGVVTMHVDVSKALDEAGIKVTMIYAGKHKVDGNPYQPLKAEVKARTQARISSLYDDFVATVVRNRGIEEPVVRGTEAACFSAAEALELGLVDAIGTPQEALSALFAVTTGTNRKEQQQMSETTNAPAQATTPAPAATVDAEALKAEASKAERARVGAIMGCEEAKGRETLAQHFAFNTSMSVEDVKAALAAAPVATQAPTAKSDAFAAAMEKTGNPNVGAGSDASAAGGGDGQETVLQRMQRNYSAGTGYKFITH